MGNGISVSYLLNEEEIIESYCIFSRMMRQKKFSIFFIVTGLCCVVASILDIAMEARLTFSNIFIMVLGIGFCLYYDGYILRVDAKKRAKKQCELQENKKLSIFFHLNEQEIEIKTDRYSLHAKPEQMWKCVENDILFYICNFSESGVAIPKRALTQQEVGAVRQVFEQSLPKGQYVKTGK